MAAQYKVLDRKDLGESLGVRERFAVDVLLGLSATNKSLPSRYFYDTRGSQLFQAITKLKDYYPTRCEAEILSRAKARLAELFGTHRFNLIELGAGDGRKTKILLEHFMSLGLDFHYIPIDISEAAVKELTESLAKSHPTLSVQGLVSEYFDGIDWIKRHSERRNVVLFLGSNIGNFTPDAARAFLLSLWNAVRHDDLLLSGFDLKKDPKALNAAYSDTANITRDFNLNLLTRINRELGANFDEERFLHVASYNYLVGAMESFLVSKEAQNVTIAELKRTFEFEAWEPIHMEFSFKYSTRQINALASQSRFIPIESFHDEKHWFVDSLWCCLKNN